jgi:hypothetical protein
MKYDFLPRENFGPDFMIEKGTVVKNYFKAIFLLMLLTVVGSFSGYVPGGRSGMMAAFAFAGLINFGVYWGRQDRAGDAPGPAPG